jgi:hypothetical protein
MNPTLAATLPREVTEHIVEFRGRGWLLPRLIEWWDRGDEQIFLLTGRPGTGKSMILARLAGLGPLPFDPGQGALPPRLPKQYALHTSVRRLAETSLLMCSRKLSRTR